MNQNDRLDLILREVREKGQVKVSELAKKLKISEVTIRNDLRVLDQHGLVKKTYGGAVNIEEELTVRFEPGNYYRTSKEKKRIAEKAYDYIDEGDSIMLDDSSTCGYLARIIRSHPEKSIVIVTNSLYSAAVLSSCKHVDLYILGGHVVSDFPSILDTSGSGENNVYHVRKFFTGIHGIDIGAGFNSMDALHMDVKKRMIRSSDSVYVLADHTKFGIGGIFSVCGFEDVECVITDQDPDPVFTEIIEQHGVELSIV